MDGPQDYLSVIVAVTIVITFIAGAIGWVVKVWLASQLAPMLGRQQQILSDITVIKKEILPNGGTSLADRVVRIEAKIDIQGPDRHGSSGFR